MGFLCVVDKFRTGMVSSGAQTLKFAELSNMVKRDIKDNLNMVKHNKTVRLPARCCETSIIYIHSGGGQIVTMRLSGISWIRWDCPPPGQGDQGLAAQA